MTQQQYQDEDISIEDMFDAIIETKGEEELIKWWCNVAMLYPVPETSRRISRKWQAYRKAQNWAPRNKNEERKAKRAKARAEREARDRAEEEEYAAELAAQGLDNQ